MLDEYVPLKCSCCGKDLLKKDYGGVIVFVEDRKRKNEDVTKTKYVDIYCACKGTCDDKLQDYYYSLGYSNGWEDISDIIIPYKYLQWVMSIINRIRSGEDIYTDKAFNKLKDFLIAISQMTLKNQSQEDIRRVMQLSVIPD